MTLALFPPVPPVDGLHPIVVHFPLGLLLTGPVFLLIAMVWRSRWREMLASAAIVCALGAAGAFAATWSGEEGEHLAELVAGTADLLHEHEERAELARNLALGMTALLTIAAGAVWRGAPKMKAPARLGLLAALLVLWLGSNLALVNAAHLGGRLVHDYGVRAPTGHTPPAGAVSPSGAAPAPAGADHDDD